MFRTPDAIDDDGIFEPSTPASFSSSSDGVVWIGPQQARVPLGRFAKMTLEVAHGASELALSAAQMPIDDEDLLAVSFDRAPPQIAVDGDVIRMNCSALSRGLLGVVTDLLLHGPRALPGPVRVGLGSAASWTLHLRGGASELRADLTDVLLDGVEISGGASEVSLVLPRPRGVVRVHISGGASGISIERPRGTALRMKVSGGASDLHFDGASVDAVGGSRRFASPGFADSGNRYEIEVLGGASDVHVFEAP